MTGFWGFNIFVISFFQLGQILFPWFALFIFMVYVMNKNWFQVVVLVRKCKFEKHQIWFWIRWYHNFRECLEILNISQGVDIMRYIIYLVWYLHPKIVLGHPISCVLFLLKVIVEYRYQATLKSHLNRIRRLYSSAHFFLIHDFNYSFYRFSAARLGGKPNCRLNSRLNWDVLL